MIGSPARTFVLVAMMLLGVVMDAVPGYATCDPTTDPDKTDVANARAAVAANCNCAGATSHGAYVSCAAQQANLTLVNQSCAGAVKRCASHSICGKPAGAVTCCVTKATGTKCKIKRDAAHCRAPVGATACVGSFTSCCDACGASGCATTTTSTTTTTTTMQGVCGDGIINQPSEQCDGAALGMCGGLGLLCGAPTVSGAACKCCIPPGAIAGCFGCTFAIPCCDGGGPSFLGPNAQACPNLTGRCDPPAVCPLGTCQADHSCCAAQGTACLEAYPALPSDFLVTAACCPGFACRAAQPGPVGIQLNCCLPDAAACTTDGVCCTGHCTGGTCDQCRAPGNACANDNECCTPSCVGGVCGPCNAAGVPCTDGVQCCSGSCNVAPDGLGTCQ